MLRYEPPVQDMQFVLFDVFRADREWARLKGFDGVDRPLAEAVLAEGGKLAKEVMAPLYQTSDAEGARWQGGRVSAPSGFKQAFQALAEGGWLGVSGDVQLGGQGLPKALSALLEELLWGANSNLYLYGALTVGAGICIAAHASDELKDAYLPGLYAGTSTGAMALTEAHAGTDLGLIRTRAEPVDDKRYAITGTKIFITSGEHDLASNIVHLVLAKLPDAPAGSAGISLFLVPKVLSDGTRNGFSSGSIEHKMGIRGSATSVINYEAATGYLIGAPNRGLACMFTMMNHARLSVGIQGLGLAELAYQNAVAYARERLQGRSAAGPQSPAQAADPILVHPDVRRMLMTQRAFVEGGRAFAAYAGLMLDRSHDDDAERRRAAQERADLLTPVVKAFVTDRGMECTLLAQQVYGGHGFIVEHGVEQIVRDIRISQIYEGTNGVQALDFTGRKVLRDGGAGLFRMLDEMRQDEVAAEFQAALGQVLEQVDRVARWLLGEAKDPNLAGAAATDFLELTGLAIYAWLWAKMAQADDDDSGRAKAETARFFYAKLLPKTLALEQSIRGGTASVMAMPDEAF